MLIGNHVPDADDIYLIGVGLLMAFWLRTAVTIRKERRRRPQLALHVRRRS